VTARALLRSKAFFFASAITLALGIAATTTIFSVVYGVLLRPLPYRDADRLVVIQGEKDFSTGPRTMNYSPIELEEFAGAAREFSAVAITGTGGFTMRGQAGIELVNGATVSAAFFDMLDVAPLAGRTFDEENAPVVVISDRLRRKHFGAAGGGIGQAIRLTDRDMVEHSYTIVGVMPPEFQYPRPQTDVWRPLGFVRSTGDDRVRERNRGGWEFVARMRDGATIDQARADAIRANDVLKPGFANSRLDIYPKATALPEYVSGTIGPALWILMGAVTLVLLVACTNVANLILARQASRAREVSMRLALGAPRGRLITYMLAESSIVAGVGGVMGVTIAFGFIRLLQYLRPVQLPRLDAIDVDLPVLAFAVGIAVMSALLAGVGPALLATRTDVMLAMRAGGRGTAAPASRRVRSALVVIEIAVSIVLLVGAALLARSLTAMIETDLGVNSENVVAAQVDLSLGRVVPPARQHEIMEALRERAAAIPGVRAAGFGTGLPPAGEFQRMSFVLSNSANTSTESHIVTLVPSSPEYFSVLQIPVLSGRAFTAADTATSPAVGIVNREAAKRFFGNDDPIGRSLPFGSLSITIVGLVENVKYTGIAAPKEAALYRPFAQQPFRVSFVLARTSGDPARIANDLRGAIRSYDANINIISIQPLTGWVSDSVAQPRFRALLLSTIATITLSLAIIGLYGVIAYSTAQRTAEIGLRVAIGARRSDVIRLVLIEGGRLAAIGIVLGIAGAYWSTQLLSAFLYQVTATDVTAFAGSAAALFVIALVATYLPARRAARVDPMIALRAE
jgi:putative ABC transport system permease protein